MTPCYKFTNLQGNMHEENCNFFDHAGFKMTLFPYENCTVQYHRPNFLNSTFSHWVDVFSQFLFFLFQCSFTFPKVFSNLLYDFKTFKTYFGKNKFIRIMITFQKVFQPILFLYTVRIMRYIS